MSTRKPPESWFWSHDIEPDQIGDTLVVPGAHMVRLAAYGEGPRLRFANLIYKEPGPAHAYHLGLEGRALAPRLAEAGQHPVSITTYLDGGARRFALVAAPGPAALSGLEIDLDEAAVRRALAAGRRVIDFATYLDGGTRRYAVLFEEHRDPGWFLTGLGARELDAEILKLGARLVRVRGYLEGGARRFAAVLEKSPGGRWSWYADLDPNAVARKLEENHAYPVDLDPQADGPAVRMSVVMYAE